MYPADNGTFQVKQALCIMQGSLNWCPACCLMMGGKWYMFWCVADFFVRPHGHMVGIVLWQPLIGVHALATLIIATWHFKSYVLDLDVQHWSSHTPLTSCRLKKDTGQHINASMLWRINLWVCGQSTLREHILRSKNINILCELRVKMGYWPGHASHLEVHVKASLSPGWVTLTKWPIMRPWRGLGAQ